MVEDHAHDESIWKVILTWLIIVLAVGGTGVGAFMAGRQDGLTDCIVNVRVETDMNRIPPSLR